LAHFRKISDESFIAYPSGRSKVTWDIADPMRPILIARVACPSGEHAHVEQTVLRDTWRAVVRACATSPTPRR